MTGKTADLTLVEISHRLGKPQKKVVAERAGCSRSAVSKHIHGELTGKKWCSRELCTNCRGNHSFERIVKQRQLKNLGELHKEWTQTGVSATTVKPLSHWSMDNIGCQVFYLGLGKKYLDRCSLVQSLLFRWKHLLHFIWKWSCQSVEEEWRGTESKLLEVQGYVSTVSDYFGCHVICWCFIKFRANAAIYSEILDHFMLLSADKDYGAAESFFLPVFAPARLYWSWYYCAWLTSQLVRHEPHV